MCVFKLPVFEIATRSAQPKLFEMTFGVGRDQFAAELAQILDDPSVLTAIDIEISWNIEFIDETGAIVWKATKLSPGEAEATLGAIPMSIEAYLIVQCLLAKCGEAVIVVPGTVAISGALAAKGDFLLRPNVEAVPGEYVHPTSDVAEIYQQADANTCEIMSGFAMDEDGLWTPAHWLVKTDGTVIAIDEPHLHYFGVRLSADAAAAFIEAYYADDDDDDDDE